jgi:hypothetical protein
MRILIDIVSETPLFWRLLFALYPCSLFLSSKLIPFERRLLLSSNHQEYINVSNQIGSRGEGKGGNLSEIHPSWSVNVAVI